MTILKTIKSVTISKIIGKIRAVFEGEGSGGLTPARGS